MWDQVDVKNNNEFARTIEQITLTSINKTVSNKL